MYIALTLFVQVPHLTTKEVCKDIPKEICVMKLVNPHPVKKPVQLKWCTKKPPPQQANLPTYAPPSNYIPASSKSATAAAVPPPSGYLPAANVYIPGGGASAFEGNNNFVKREDLTETTFLVEDDFAGLQDALVPLPLGQ